MDFRAALITGAADRLGRAMALDLAASGVNVAIHYSSSKAKAEDVVKQAQQLGVKAVALQADLTKRAETDALVTRAANEIGQLDVLINNASIFEYDNLESADHNSWDRHMSSNFEAPFILTQAFSAQAPKVGNDGEPIARATVINMVDQRVRKLTPEFMTYSLAKNALWAAIINDP